MSGKYRIEYTSDDKYIFPEGSIKNELNGWLLPESVADKKNIDNHYEYFSRLSVGSTLYGNTYVAFHFMQIHRPKEVIFIETFKGLIPYMIAKEFDCHVHVFTKKKVYFTHPKMTVYNRLPDDNDFFKLKNMHLINTLIYAPKIPTTYGRESYPYYASSEAIRYIDRFMPVASVSHFPVTVNDFYSKTIRGEFWIAPFYLTVKTNAFFLHQTGINTKYMVINNAEINARIYTYRMYLKFRDYGGYDYDTKLCREVLDKVRDKKMIIDMLGPLPNKNNPHIKFITDDLVKQYTGDNNIENTYVGDLYENYFTPMFTGNFMDDVLLMAFVNFAQNTNKYLYVNDSLTDILKNFCKNVVIENSFNYRKIDHKFEFADNRVEANKKYDLMDADLLESPLIDICVDYIKRILYKPKTLGTDSKLIAAVVKKAFPKCKITDKKEKIYYTF